MGFNKNIRAFIRHARNLRFLGMMAFGLLTLLVFATIFPIVRHEDFAEAAYTPATSSLAIVSSKDTASVDVTPTSSNGTFVISSIGDEAEFTVTTNNLTGYSLNILGTDTSGQLVNAISGDTLDTLASDTDEGTFRNGSADSYSNKWGYRLNINDTTTTDFMSAPTTATSKTIYTTSSPNTVSDNYKLGLGARVDYTKASGTYTNTFVLTAVGNPISYQINYLDGSTGTDTPALPAEAESNITASAFTLSTTTPTKSGYDFVGWCDGTVNYAVDPNSCTGTTYNPGDSYTFSSMPSTGTATANLYAMWDRLPEIQNLDPSLCVTGTQTRTVDARDGNEYTVTRLPDGNCWMTKNLDLTGGTILTSSNSNLNGSLTSYALPVSETITSGTDLPSTAFSDNDTAYVFNSGSTTCSDSSPCYSYYSYKAATAGTGGSSLTTGNAPSDICPKGWRLPTKTEYTALMNTYTTGDTLTATPFNGIYAGDYFDGSFSGGGSYGFYWSSTVDSASSAYRLFFRSSVANVTDYSKRFGYSVRCVRKNLYDTVVEMSKGTQTAADLQAAITIPTSADRTLDTSNSGVYEYNSSVFGTATDASNAYKIYYYRGVLENSVSSYGSNGSAVTYPNYVKLGNTCWRILRTTGSGGVKMIYNGNWTGTTCANSANSAQIGTSTFSVDSNKRYGSAFGYTQNDSYNSSNLSATYSTMFGSNTSFSVNSTDSGIKTKIENWYNNTSGIKATYGSHLEADAGYCADRTLNSGTSWTTPIADSATVSTITDYYTGAYIRNKTNVKSPSLTCPRGSADVYTTSAATTGNKQLSESIALITADEASFAGSGSTAAADGSSYHANSFLRSGSHFWLLSPTNRFSTGSAYVFYLYSTGHLYDDSVKNALGVRPAISLSQGAKISSGNGTATSPWEVSW